MMKEIEGRGAARPDPTRSFRPERVFPISGLSYFAGACALGSAYGFLQGAWPFGLIEAIWALVAARRWWLRKEWGI